MSTPSDNQITPPLSQPVLSPNPPTSTLPPLPGGREREIDWSTSLFSGPWQTWFQNLVTFLVNITGSFSGIGDTDIFYSKAGVPFGDSNLQWLYGSQILKITNPVSTDEVQIGGASITALYQGVHGKTMWFLANTASDGLFGVSNGSGTGGFDGNGATIYGQGSSGALQAVSLAAQNLATPARALVNQNSFAMFNAAGNLVFLTEAFSTDTLFEVADANGNVFLHASTSPTNLLKVTNIATSNLVEIGGSSISALYDGVAGQTMWFLANAASDGLFGVSNGSGTGGFDGNGATIYGQGATGELEVGSLVVNNTVTSHKITINQNAASIQNLLGNLITFLGDAGSGAGLLELNDSTGATVLKFDASTGLALIASLGGGGTQMVTADNTGALGVQAIPGGGFPSTWTSYSPTVSAGGGGTVTSTTLTASYIQTGKTVFIQIYLSATTAGTVNVIFFTLPANPLAGLYQSASATVDDSSGFNAGAVLIDGISSNDLYVYKPNTGAYGGSVQLWITGVYQSA